ncbi:hypothetical protein [Deinococcus sp. QL22]|uniref:hypothetical protein n=1 Tax=Deinococcus sp. QL22 TaxID=2939437 RepID=UPI002016E409|nr:hypothetical protein [Deinococcus sp. QL22]UQN05033.1 hypothetical protein M1R55_08930 [Deinococcus sp. QL22]
MTAQTGASAAPLKLSYTGRSVTVRQAGRVLWSRAMRAETFPAHEGILHTAPLRGVLGRVAYVTSCTDGSRLYCFTAGFDKRSGHPLFTANGTPVAIGAGQLITNYWSDPADMPFTVVQGTRIDLSTGKASRVAFSIPPRPGCGSLNISVGLIGRTTYDARFAYAEQDDKCGAFVARFDWHGPNSQQPVLLPYKKTPATP